MFKRLVDALFGKSLPPASSDGDDGGWNKRDCNKTLRTTIGKRADAIRMADEHNRKRYDAMDTHIASLKKMAEDSRERKTELKAIRSVISV